MALKGGFYIWWVWELLLCVAMKSENCLRHCEKNWNSAHIGSTPRDFDGLYCSEMCN
jgi:hypothetical protein